jgi:hypothetical protein
MAGVHVEGHAVLGDEHRLRYLTLPVVETVGVRDGQVILAACAISMTLDHALVVT